MAPLRTMENIALVGFMGAGKSSVALLVARRLGFQIVDTDKMIEEETGRTVEQIFSEDGEGKFREWERKIVKALTHLSQTIISTGGGLVVDPANLESLRRHSLGICLWASPETIWERVRHQNHRPLLKGPDPLETIRRLLVSREKFYRQADALVNTDGRSTRQVAHQVLHHYQLAARDRSA
jgi:shikimate kinase